jgi:penicillin-binding protein 1A
MAIEVETGSEFPEAELPADKATAVVGTPLIDVDVAETGVPKDSPDISAGVLARAAEEPMATDEPATDEPATDEPATDEPTTDEPETDEPATDEPATDVIEAVVEELETPDDSTAAVTGV